MELLEKNTFFGLRALKKLSFIINDNNYKNLLIITGKNSFKYSGLQAKLECELKGITKYYINDFENNPKYDDVQRIGESLFHKRFDLIVAIGGGSVIDFAKCLNLYLHISYDGLNPHTIFNDIQKININIPILAIPTTAGTGSEATHFAVLYEKGRKYSVAHKKLCPEFVIIDPILTLGLPKEITASNFFDALCQAIESYWSLNANLLSKEFAIKAIEELLQFRPNYSEDNEINERAKLSRASYFSGKAINITKTTAPHAMSYVLTSEFNIPHGYAVALSFGRIFMLNERKDCILSSSASSDFTIKTHMKNMQDLRRILKIDPNESGLLFWNNLLKKFNLNTKLDIKLDHSKIDYLCSSINLERLSNHPIKINPADIREIYKEIFLEL